MIHRVAREWSRNSAIIAFIAWFGIRSGVRNRSFVTGDVFARSSHCWMAQRSYVWPSQA